MKSISTITLLLLFTITLLAGQKKQDGSARGVNAEQELAQLETEFYDAYARGDAQKIEQLLASDYTHNDIRGGFKNRAAYMMYISNLADAIKAGAVKIESSTIDDLRVRVYGDSAVA